MAIRFNKEWMDKVEYKDWLLPEPSNITKTKCRLGMRSFSLSNMGEPALKSPKGFNIYTERGTISM